MIAEHEFDRAAGTPQQHEQQRELPQPRKKRRRLRITLISTLVTLLVVALAGTAFAGNYLATYALVVDEDGRLASMGDGVYNGVQDTDAQRAFDAWAESAPAERWNLVSHDGLALTAVFYPASRPSDVYILAVHGYTVDHRDIEPAILPFAERGYNVLTIDERGRGDSAGDFVSMGYFEKTDVVRWAEKIVDADPDAQIVLYGESMGGATVLQAAGEQLPPQVVAVVEDCGYTSAYAMFRDQLKARFGLPEFPFLPAADVVSQMRFGFSFSNADALDALTRAELPVLFIHGGADDYVPTYMGKELYDAYQGEKELLIVPGAGHGQSADVDPDGYYATVFEFLDRFGL